MKGLVTRGSGKYLASSKSSPNLQGPPRADTVCVLGKECRSRRRLATADNDASGPPASAADLKGAPRPNIRLIWIDLADLEGLQRVRHLCLCLSRRAHTGTLPPREHAHGHSSTTWAANRMVCKQDGLRANAHWIEEGNTMTLAMSYRWVHGSECFTVAEWVLQARRRSYGRAIAPQTCSSSASA